ncbi:MAG: translocation protein TolB [Schlesneria sp.]|nr:translocation protein TolB [Schlesneria sp.]
MIADPVGDWVEEKLKQVTAAVRKGPIGEDHVKASEWPVTRINEISADLGSIPTETWDRDGDDSITLAECRVLLEIAYGIRKADGSTLRLPSGRMLNLDVFGQFDANEDGALSQAECVARQWMRPEQFQQRDLNHNGQLDWSEFAACPEMTLDPLEEFYWYDTNLDGQIDELELVADAAAHPWHKNIGARLMAAFSTQGGVLTYRDFQATPFANHVTDWYSPLEDKNQDVKISWAEFYNNTTPQAILLYREYFNRFDRDHDGSLSYDEYKFPLDMLRVPAEYVFVARDRDGNQLLTLEEFLDETPPTYADQVSKNQFEMRRQFVAELIAKADTSGDGRLSLAEYAASKPERLLAIHLDFVRRDVDGDRRVARSEYAAPNIGSKSEEVARVESALFDLDDDGFLSWQEFQCSPPASPSAEDLFVLLDTKGDRKLYLGLICASIQQSNTAQLA